MKKLLSERQLRQRREAGQALASRVSRDYYRFIGQRGGRNFKANCLLWLSRHYDVRQDAPALAATWSPAQVERFNEMRRQDFRDLAGYYRQPTGTRMMLVFFLPEYDIKPARRRLKTPSGRSTT